MINKSLPIAITAGEPAGIGPDLCLLLAAQGQLPDSVVFADAHMLAERAAQLACPVRIRAYERGIAPQAQAGLLWVQHVPAARPVEAGQLNVHNAAYVLKTLDLAIAGCMAGEFSAMVTAPVHKGIINQAGIAFTGHTEYLAHATQTPQVVMMLVGAGMRVALVTTHLPLRAVSAAITADHLSRVIRILHADLQIKFGVNCPQIIVAGLNPHAGEGGHIGREELDVIIPTLNALRAEGLQLIGPLPADTLFNPHRLAGTDAVLAMYHDQGLPVLKYASFGSGVNVTLGLPMIRTSVDHGTALDLAATGRIETGSMQAAIALAAQLAGHSTPPH